jgi:opacity protein-like surface antigen
MKTIPLLLLGFSLPVFAGTSAKEAVAPAVSPEPCLFTWFTGASVGYLTEFEEPMYNFHIGADTCWKLGGWDVALFAEIGYTEKDDSWSNVPGIVNGDGDGDLIAQIAAPPPPVPDSLDLDELEDALAAAAAAGFGDTNYDLDVMPITLNAKLERPLTGNLNAYFGGGLGMALVDLSADGGVLGSASDDDWVFTAQLFAGLNYNINETFEVYGGARWIYFDDADIEDVTFELDDDFLFEIGGRINF